MADTNIDYNAIGDQSYEYTPKTPISKIDNSNSSVNYPTKVHNKDDMAIVASSTTGRSSMFNAIHLSVAFCLVFMAFNVAQNSQTSDLGTPGNIGLGILYGTFTVCNLFSSWLIHVIGVNLSLCIGALTYALYVACNVHIINELLFVSSAIIGFGASIIWTAQGYYISYCATSHEATFGLPSSSTMGMFNGIFFLIFQVNQFAGNLLAALLYQFEISKQTVFIVMTCICALGSFFLFFLQRPHTLKVKEEDESKPIISRDPTESQLNVYSDDSQRVVTTSRVEMPTLSKFLASLTLFSDPRMLYTICIIIYSGLSQTFIYGAFTSFFPINETNWKFYAMSCFGGVDAITSGVVGKLSDKVGRAPILALGFIAHGATFIYFMFFFSVNDSNPHWLFFLLATGLGVGDAVFNSQVYAILGTFFEHKADQAFANYKLFQSGSTAVAFIYSIYYPAKYVFFQSLVPSIFLVLGCASLFFCHFFYHSLDASGNKTTGKSIENLAAENALGEDFAIDDSEDTRKAMHRRHAE